MPAELDLERWELLAEVLDHARGAEVRGFVQAYGGFAAEDSGQAVWAVHVERVVERLREEIEARGGSEVEVPIRQALGRAVTPTPPGTAPPGSCSPRASIFSRGTRFGKAR
ncbi:MAG: hypothetical protein IPP07_29475 [Holophagales bacterium]|nr:hypothetical protein [Holophagales bacterium]